MEYNLNNRLWSILSEILFLLALSSIAAILWTGGFQIRWWGVTFSFFSLKNPFLYLFLLLGAHLATSRTRCFALGRSTLCAVQWPLERAHRSLAAVHWGLKSALLLALILTVVFVLDKRPLPGPMRDMTSKPGKRLLHYCTKDLSLDFPGSSLRRDFSEADRFESTWRGHLFVSKKRKYSFAIEGDGFYRFKIAGKTIIDNSPDWRVERREGQLVLPVGSHPFELYYGDIAHGSTLQLFWKKSDGPWMAVPAHRLTLENITAKEYRSLERRATLRPLFIIGCLFLIWHLMLLGVEKWSGLSQNARRRWCRYLVAFLLLLALGLRLQFLIRSGAMTHADEGIVGLMAQHIAEGSDFPLMYYDQDYNGTLLAWGLAPLYLLFGASLWNLKGMTCFLSVLMVYLVYRIARRWMGHGASLIAALLSAVPPVMCVVYGLMALVGPIEGAVADLVILWVAMPMIFAENTSWKRYCLLGFLCGLAVWMNFQVFYYLLPIGVFYILQGRRTLMRLPLVIGGSLVGLLPLLAYNIAHGWPTIKLFMKEGVEKDYGAILGDYLIRLGLPHILGSRVRWDMHRSFTPEPLPQIVGILFGLALLSLLVFVVYQIWGKGAFDRLRKSPQAFVLAFFLSVLFFYLKSDYGEYYPRYLFTTYPMIAILFGWWVTWFSGHLRALGAVAVMVLFMQNAIGNWKVDPFYFSQPVHYVDRGMFLPERNTELLEYLEKENLTRIHCDYWIAYVLALESGEKVMAESDRDRCSLYREEFLRSPRTPYLFHVHDSRTYFYREIFSRRLGYEVKEIAPYVLFIPPEKSIPKGQWKVAASADSEEAFMAADGDITWFSSWRTRIEQGQAWLSVDLGREVEMEQVMLTRDWPSHEDSTGQGLVQGQLWLSNDGENWQLQEVQPEKGAFDHVDHFTFPRRKARYIKITNRPEAYPYLWSVYDMFVR